MRLTVVEEHSYVADLYKLSNEFPRVHEVNEAVSWALSRRPDAGDKIQMNGKYRVFLTTEMGSVPSFVVLYLYDDETDPDCIYLLSIRND